MADQPTFRLLFTIVVAVFAAAWGWNFLSVGVSRQSFYTPTEGAAVAVPLRVLVGASLLSIFAYLTNPRWIAWAGLPLPAWVRWFGFLLSVIALGLFIWIIRSLGHNFSMTLTIKPEQTLVTHGPYRWVRHPMYPTFIMMWLSFCLMTANWLIGLTGILAFAWTMAVRTPKEEQMMAKRFGEEYIAYIQQTPRYLPCRLWRKTSADKHSMES